MYYFWPTIAHSTSIYLQQLRIYIFKKNNFFKAFFQGSRHIFFTFKLFNKENQTKLQLCFFPIAKAVSLLVGFGPSCGGLENFFS